MAPHRRPISHYPSASDSIAKHFLCWLHRRQEHGNGLLNFIYANLIIGAGWVFISFMIAAGWVWSLVFVFVAGNVLVRDFDVPDPEPTSQAPNGWDTYTPGDRRPVSTRVGTKSKGRPNANGTGYLADHPYFPGD